MKKTLLIMLAATVAFAGCKPKSEPVEAQVQDEAVVYMTTDISPEALIKVYEALGVKA